MFSNENYELKIFKNTIFLNEISNNWPNKILGTDVYMTLESGW